MRSARKHIAWYLRSLPGGEALRQHINTIEDCGVQFQAVADYLEQLATQMDRLPVAAASSHAQPQEESAGQTA
ncbi:tRNA-dihydrouridine synthase B [compost metagenome]